TLDDIRVGEEALLDLGRRHPHAANLEELVAPPPKPEEAVGVPDEEVARLDEVAAERLFRLLVLVPVEERRRIALDPERAHLAVGDLTPVLVDHPHRVAGHHLADAARSSPPGPARMVDVVRLGR